MVSHLITGLVLGAHLWPLRQHPGAFAALVLLIVLLVVTYRQRRPIPGEAVLAPALLIVVGAALADPGPVVGVATAYFASLAMHGSTRQWALRTVLGLGVLPGSMALVALSTGVTVPWSVSDMIGMVPAGVAMRGVYLILAKQELVTQRDQLLSTAGARLLAATTIEEVRGIGAELSSSMVALVPGIVLLVLRQFPEGLTVLRGLPEGRPVRGEILPPTAVTDPKTYFAELAPDVRHWRAEKVADGVLLLGGRRRVPDDVVASFRNLIHQVVLGETSRRMLAELHHRAHYDDLTGLANRVLFRQRLEAAVTGDPAGSVALCTVDLDDFKRVNDTLGHAAGDDLLVEVARRIQLFAGPGDTAARLGGDEFALLLTGLTGPAEAELRAAALRTELASFSVPASAGIGMASASIGVASTADARSITELLRQADTAMYAAKAAGKNRVERFTGERRAPAAQPAPGWSVPAS